MDLNYRRGGKSSACVHRADVIGRTHGSAPTDEWSAFEAVGRYSAGSDAAES